MNRTFRLTVRLLVPALVVVALLAAALFRGDRDGFTRAERALLDVPDSVLYVEVVDDPSDYAILRTPCTDLSDKALLSDGFRKLAAKMLATVRAPEQDGVGIAAPQVGLSRRVICVQRLDKPGEPFEVYANVRIDTAYGDRVRGPEGCLSVPPYRGYVTRWTDVVVSWKDVETLNIRRDTIHGYTAVIFQHECDHLDGILYTDRADTVFYNASWAAERARYDSLGCYRRK
jgi:peptide deformylase